MANSNPNSNPTTVNQSSQSQPAPSFTVRPATESDVPHILALIRELADYEHALDKVEATEDSLLATLSFPSKPGQGYAKTLLLTTSAPAVSEPSSTSGSAKTTPPLLDTSGQHVAGMALYFHNYSTWTSAPGIYLEDLFVRPMYRGRGYGTALLQALAVETVKVGGRRLEWSVLKWNEPSIRFYEGEGVGATRMEEWVGMRVEGEGLGRLAVRGFGEGGA